MEHYNEDYFLWQREMGRLGARLNKFLFKEYINPKDSVIDFGCGGAFLLKELKSKQKLGVEINPSGRENAQKLGIDTVESISQIDDNWATVVISNHALEHVDKPLDILIELKDKMKTGAKIVFVTPFERTNPYKPNDINNHLYTWSPMNLGNLFNRAGYNVISVEKISHRWPPKFDTLVKIFGFKAVHMLSRVYGFLNRKQTQVRIVAVK